MTAIATTILSASVSLAIFAFTQYLNRLYAHSDFLKARLMDLSKAIESAIHLPPGHYEDILKLNQEIYAYQIKMFSCKMLATLYFPAAMPKVQQVLSATTLYTTALQKRAEGLKKPSKEPAESKDPKVSGLGMVPQTFLLLLAAVRDTQDYLVAGHEDLIQSPGSVLKSWF